MVNYALCDIGDATEEFLMQKMIWKVIFPILSLVISATYDCQSSTERGRLQSTIDQ